MSPESPLPRPELIQRALFTLGALLVYRLGCHIPLPGIDPGELDQLSVKLNLSTEVVSLFALGVTPILSTLLIVEFVKLLFPPLARWEAASEANVRRLRNVIYVMAVLLAAFQARGIAMGLYGIPQLIHEPGWIPYMVAAMVAGTMLLGWLGDRISRQGIGSGFWLLVITPTLVKLPAAGALAVRGWQEGFVTPGAIVITVVFLVVPVALVATLGSARYDDVAPTSNRVSGVDFVAVWPPLFAVYAANFILLMLSLQPGGALHLALIALLIFGFSWLQSRGEPLEAPAWRPIWIIMLTQIVVCVGSEALNQAPALPFNLSGSWLIVVVAAAMNILRRSRLVR